LALSRRRDGVRKGETLPRAWGPAPAPKPEPVLAPQPVTVPALTPAPAFLRLGRVDEHADADRRARRHEGLVRAGY
ncbi:hypothetical protein NL533_35295, partial [Klebsiella pneumoniae]|nr:hypothetical protein [Klebsiella pneumoniae]